MKLTKRTAPSILLWKFTSFLFAIGILGWSIASVIDVPAVFAVDDEKSALQSDQSFKDALTKADKTTASSLLDGDFAWTDADGETRTRIETLENLAAP
jgi:hypothetical protein